MRAHILFFAIICALAPSSYAGLPVTMVSHEADAVVVSTIPVIQQNTEKTSIQLQVTEVLKGDGQPGLWMAQLSRPEGTSADHFQMDFTQLVGTTAIWFLKGGGTGTYAVMPLCAGTCRAQEVFLPVAAGALRLDRDLDTRLVNYHLDWYKSLSKTSFMDDSWLLSSLSYGAGSSSSEAIRDLMSSPRISDHAIGIAASIRLGRTPALTALAAELPALGASDKFYAVIEALELYCRPDASSLPALNKLIAEGSETPKLHVAIASVLTKAGGKEVLPGMVLLLDSKDRLTQIRAAAFISTFTVFADANGNNPGKGAIGPFFTTETRQNAPRRGDSPERTAAVVQFWRSWWADNRGKLGF